MPPRRQLLPAHRATVRLQLGKRSTVSVRCVAVTFRSAGPADAQAVSELVDAAYRHYVERIGMLPGPMTQDYADVIATRQTTIAEIAGVPAGVLVLSSEDGQFVIENVAVHPDHRGTGVGRALLDLAEAEARRTGFDDVHLWTHELMTENLAIYTKARLSRGRASVAGHVRSRVPEQAPGLTPRTAVRADRSGR